MTKKSTITFRLIALAVIALLISFNHTSAFADKIDDYLVQWATEGKADEQLVNNLLLSINITGKKTKMILLNKS